MANGIGTDLRGLMARLLSLDFDPVYGDEATRARFAGDVSAFDYDVVIWDPAASFGTYLSPHQARYQNLPSLAGNESVRIQADAKRRHAEFTEFLEAGRVLVVVVRPPQGCYVDTGRREHSGTGRNRQTTTIVTYFDLLSALPDDGTTAFSAATGTRVQLIGDGPLVRLMRKWRDRLRYSAVMAGAPGSVLAQVADTDRHVAAVLRTASGGHLILLPAIDLDRPDFEPDEEDEDERWIDTAAEFQEDLLSAIDQLAGSKVNARPAWASQFATKKQSELRESLAEQQGEVEAARTRLAMLRQQAEEAEARDQLFLGTGRALELEVKEVLELLGGTVTEPEPGRDDWKVTFDEGRAVIEVKGVTKSAAEKHAAQLEKWVATELEETGSAPKGILVVNTWRETPLDRRTEPDFPDQMLKYSVGRDHCLVTGLQLFCIREEVEADPSRADFWRQRLMTTAGVLDGVLDWRDFIDWSTPAE